MVDQPVESSCVVSFCRVGEWRHPFCRMVDYSGEWSGLYSPNVKNKQFYRMVRASCRIVTILQNSLFIHHVQIWRTGHSQWERVWLAMLLCRMYPRQSLFMQNGVYPPILQNGTS
eukprot:3601949-Pleurochrysis_carterae.AAC.1